MSIEENKKLEDFLSSLFVEKKELFDEVIKTINKNIRGMKLDFQYTYDDFCRDYLELNKEFFERHSDVDFTDMNSVPFYTNIIIGELFERLKLKYDKNDK